MVRRDKLWKRVQWGMMEIVQTQKKLLQISTANGNFPLNLRKFKQQHPPRQ